MATISHKTCIACGQIKSVSEFYFADRIFNRYGARCKACKIAQVNEKRKANPEQRKAYDRAYRERNADRSKEQYSPEKRAERYAAEREESVEASRRWRQENPDLKRAQKHRRRARLAENGGSYTRADWEAIKQAQDYTCLACGRREPQITLTVDHIIPISKGGTNDAGNMQGLCIECNNRKRARSTDYRR